MGVGIFYRPLKRRKRPDVPGTIPGVMVCARVGRLVVDHCKPIDGPEFFRLYSANGALASIDIWHSKEDAIREAARRQGCCPNCLQRLANRLNPNSECTCNEMASAPPPAERKA